MINHPVLQKKANTISYFAIWGLISGLHIAVLVYLYHTPWIFASLHSIIHNVIFAFLGLSIWFIVLQDNPESTPKFTSIVNHLGAAALAILFWISISDLLIDFIKPDKNFPFTSTEGGIAWRVIVGLFYYAAISLLYYLTAAYQNLKIRLEKESDLRSLLRESELKALKSQINPHFLFNSLNSISALTFEEPNKAREMIIKLSEFMRYALKSRETQYSSLQKELDTMKKYLDIEKIRFGERLQIDIRTQDQCLGFNIPHLILQPLVENAIKHGVYESISTNILSIECSQVDQYLSIIISNDIDQLPAKKAGEGVGLLNVQNRLKAHFDENARLTWKTLNNRFIVELIIPVRDHAN